MASDGSLPWLYLDAALVAVNKPAGWMVHRHPRVDDAPVVLQTVRDRLGERVYPVHRLDRGTSGVLVFARNPAMAGKLGEAFANQRVHKTYLVVARGYLPERTVAEHPIAARGKTPQPALTFVRCLARTELPIPVGRYETARYSLGLAYPVSGRWHQIRRHLNYLAHPVIGDAEHGDRHHNRFVRDTLGLPRLFLHARVLEFPHPQHRRAIRLTAPLDAQWRGLLHRFGWSTSAVHGARCAGP